MEIRIKKLAKSLDIHAICRECDRAGSADGLVFCSGCGAATEPVHRECLRYSRRSRHQQGGRRCREVGYKEYVYMTYLLTSDHLDKYKKSLHLKDMWTTWFGLPQEQPCKRYPRLSIWSRLASVASDDERLKSQYPSLVTFVGPTGSGKSSIIRALIHLLSKRHEWRPGRMVPHEVPVPGAVTAYEQYRSTSSDVHLYADPRTQNTELPMYFADCEGLSGCLQPQSSEIQLDAAAEEARLPREERLRKKNLKGEADQDPAAHQRAAQGRMEIHWGHMDCPRRLRGEAISSTTLTSDTDDEGTHADKVDDETRQRVVRELYPRLLYIFSDVVCFVANSTQSAEDMLATLFNWGQTGHDKTFNKRARPGLIIIMNKTTEQSHRALGGASAATAQLLRSFQDTQRFRDQQQLWSRRTEMPILSIEQLIRCYYQDFCVVSVPSYTSEVPSVAGEIASSLRNLYNTIRWMSDRVRDLRRPNTADISRFGARFLKTAQELAKDCSRGIDLLDINPSNTRLPQTFHEHLVHAASSLSKTRGLDIETTLGGEIRLVRDMIPFVAVCIVSQLRQVDPILAQYRKPTLVEEAIKGLQQFCDEVWRCEFTCQHNNRTWRCRNTYRKHRDHQFDDEDGLQPPDLLVAPFQCSFDIDAFIRQLWDEIHGLRRLDLSQLQLELRNRARRCHLYRMSTQKTCLACLSNCPTNVLPCTRDRLGLQHAICESCVRRHDIAGPLNETSLARLAECPLGCRFETTCRIRLKPITAGSRVLALDGGGIRGVVELCFLAKIQAQIGFGIRIQELFDLVIGTSTGGIVALGIFKKGWDPDSAMTQFMGLARSAFQRRKSLQLPIYSIFATPFCDYKYSTLGIDSTLKKTFGDGFLFGQPTGSSSRLMDDSVKVGVVSTKEGSQRVSVIANYSRNPVGKEDALERAEVQRKDFRIWQAARATSAAPLVFAPYHHKQSHERYLDGALLANNPVQVAYDESQKVWPGCRPEIIISIGTGMKTDREGKAHCSTLFYTKSKMVPSFLRKRYTIVNDAVKSTFDCHAVWSKFDDTHGDVHVRKSNLHRFDLPLPGKKPPKIDEVELMGGLVEECKAYLDRPEALLSVDHVADQLRAKLFCFSDGSGDPEVLARNFGASQTIRGYIHCRLPPGSDGARRLLSQREGRPRFILIEEERDERRNVQQISYFDPETLEAVVQFRVSRGRLRRYIIVSFAGISWQRISNFSK